MTNQTQPNLALGEPPKRLAPTTGRLPRGWLWTLLLLQIIMCSFLMVLLLRSANDENVTQNNGGATADELKATAIELEDRSLDAQAAETWRAYLQATPNDADRAGILYRIGWLYFQAEQYDKAVTALVHAEQVSDDDELKSKIGPKIVDCLRRLGRYGEVGRELSRRVEVGAEKTAQGRVLATFAGESFTEADLDRMIERNVDEMLTLHEGNQGQATRDALLERLSTPTMRRQLLNDMLRRDLFSRRARDLKLDREEQFQRSRQLLEDNLLANQFLAQELKSIQPTDVDIEAYYQANKRQYEQPDQMSVVTLDLDADASSLPSLSSLLKQINSPDDFKKMVAERSGTEPASGQPSTSQQLIRGRFHAKLGNTEPLFQLSEGEWTKEPHVNADNKYLVLVEKKTPGRVPPMEHIRQQIEADYRSRKRQELTERLFHDLMSRYDVRIKPIEETAHTDPPTRTAKEKSSSKQSDEEDPE